uniref:Uncharacterized protein n=1 Tax=uncultured Desulfobacterium sp. TaxID=201089 RepID=E1YAD8_9BACT|nr:unknown protein [uncultured Desulfobacterium sp.]
MYIDTNPKKQKKIPGPKLIDPGNPIIFLMTLAVLSCP